MRVRSRTMRALSSAVPARRPSSAASATSSSVIARPDSALTRLSAPMGSPEATIGTVSACRTPMVRRSAS
jgi:hypothetical protein